MFDGYIRVSRVQGRDGESFISPDVQRKAIQRFARASDLEVRMNEPELDVTGSKLARPILDGIMERIRSGESEGVIVATVDRLSRAGLGDAIKLVEGISAAGATVGFAELGNVDPKTITGEMIVNMWLSIARMQWRQYKEKWATAQERAVERGIFVGPPSLGFEKREKNKAGKLVGPLHPNGDAPKVVKAFEVSASDGIAAALKYCEATWPDRPWSTNKVRRLLANRIYKGEVVNGTMVGHIEPLVDETLWDFAQHPGRDDSRRRPKSVYPLSGIAKCAACGGPLVGHTTGKAPKQHRAYRCTTKDCPLHLKAAPLEALVLDAVRSDFDGRGLTGDEILKFTAPIVAARGELEAFVTNASALNAELFQQGVASREAKLADAQRAWDEARERSGELPDLEDPTPEERRRIFERAVGSLIVRRGREPLVERVGLELAA